MFFLYFCTIHITKLVMNKDIDTNKFLYTMNTILKDKPFIVIDMNSGSYVKEEVGHEVFNLSRHPHDGRYHGYCPPNDHININKLGAKQSDENICGVLVIYVQKIKSKSDREIIAFCDNATVHRSTHERLSLQRNLSKDKKNIRCTYSIESDYLCDLTNVDKKFIIKIADYNVYMFRMQRFFKGTYPELDKKIIKYLEGYLYEKELDDDFTFQEEVQNEDLSSGKKLINTSEVEPQYSIDNGSKTVKKNSRISKQALECANYACSFDKEHKTFTTPKNIPYMEGHHLIPCTSSNAERFWKEQHRNIDCEENIVCICPTCHRCIHFGAKEEKNRIIKRLYEIQEPKFKQAGLNIKLKELLDLYKI